MLQLIFSKVTCFLTTVLPFQQHDLSILIELNHRDYLLTKSYHFWFYLCFQMKQMITHFCSIQNDLILKSCLISVDYFFSCLNHLRKALSMMFENREGCLQFPRFGMIFSCSFVRSYLIHEIFMMILLRSIFVQVHHHL